MRLSLSLSLSLYVVMQEFMFVGGQKGCKLQVVADELLASPADVKKAIEGDTVNAVVVDVAKRATVTGSVRQCIKVRCC